MSTYVQQIAGKKKKKKKKRASNASTMVEDHPYCVAKRLSYINTHFPIQACATITKCMIQHDLFQAVL